MATVTLGLGSSPGSAKVDDPGILRHCLRVDVPMPDDQCPDRFPDLDLAPTALDRDRPPEVLLNQEVHNPADRAAARRELEGIGPGKTFDLGEQEEFET